MILVYGHCDGWRYEYQAWKPLGLVATVAEAEALCAAYATQRVDDSDGIWHLHWVALEAGLTLPQVSNLLAQGTAETRAHGDDTTPAEAQAQAEDAGGARAFRQQLAEHTRAWKEHLRWHSQGS